MGKYIIGVDPDLRFSGYAIWDTEASCIKEYGKASFRGLIKKIESYNGECLVRIEGGWLNKKANWHFSGLGSRSEKIAYRVGQNHAVGLVLESYLRESGIECEVVKPRNRKINRSEFSEITGISGRINQDIMDAIMLVYGYNGSRKE